MSNKTTEHLHECAIGLDQRPAHEIGAILIESQVNAAVAVRGAIKEICEGASAMARAILGGKRIYYTAAGSSGLMAAADAQELGGTFSISEDQLRILMAGGLPQGVTMPGETEDDTESLARDLANLEKDDVVIAVSASGSTPFTMAAARIAKSAGATVIGIANNRGAELLRLADHPILLETPPEVISGSTRMGAGTAQKIALNTLSSLMAVELGHVHDGMMVNLHADNFKLQARAQNIVQQIAEVPQATASDALEAAGGDVKSAVLIAAHGLSPETAATLLNETRGHLRPAMGKST